MACFVTALHNVVLSLSVGEHASIEDMRRSFDEILNSLSLPDGVQFEPYSNGPCPGEWAHAQDADVDQVIFYLHGGGYMMGSARGYREFCGRLAIATKAKVLCIDYSLAPEKPFPAALNDAYSTYIDLLDQGYDPSRISFGGDSAGAGLALGLLMKLRDGAMQLPASAFLLCPFLDLRSEGDSVRTKAAVDPIGTPESGHMIAANYAPRDLDNPYASPISGDFSNLPKLLIMAGTRDRLLDDAVRAANAATRAGLAVELVLENDLIHVWFLWGNEIPESKRTLSKIAEFVGHN